MKKDIFSTLKNFGPGIAVAATGVGAGDLVAASVAGAKFGTIILWSAVLGAVIKFALNEGVARWQLATGSTMIEGWFSKLPRIISYYFLVYLILWSFIVAAALISACGLAGHAIFPQLSVNAWGIIHSLLGVVLVYVGRYRLFEKLMGLFTALMFVTVMYCAVMMKPDLSLLIPSMFIPILPEGSAKFILSVMGGVGGSVTLLSYGYWIREKQWEGKDLHRHTQRDLGVGYTLTGLFGVAMMVIAAGVNPAVMTGDSMALEVGQRIGDVLGPTGKWMFLLGFWGAVFTSLFGVWQSVPYFFADCITNLKSQSKISSTPSTIHGSRFTALQWLFTLPRLPANAALVVRQTGLGDYHLFDHRRVLHAVPRCNVALSEQQAAMGRRTEEPMDHERSACPVVDPFRLSCYDGNSRRSEMSVMLNSFQHLFLRLRNKFGVTITFLHLRFLPRRFLHLRDILSFA